MSRAVTTTLSAIDSEYVDQISSSRGEPGWMVDYRKSALSVYDSMPIETSPLYKKYTDAKMMNPEAVSLSAAGHGGGVAPPVLDKRLAELDGQTHIIQVGTHTHRVVLGDEARSKGVVVSSMDDALKNHPDLVRGALEASDPREDKFTALNNAAFNTGVFVHVPGNVNLESPIHAVSCLPADDTSVIARNMVVAGPNSRSTVVQELYSQASGGDGQDGGGKVQRAYLELFNTTAGAGARVDGTTLQMLDQESVNFSTRRADIAADANINWYLGLFGALLSRYRADYHLNESGASANDSEVVFGNNDQSFDLQTNVNHHSPSTEGRVIEKSILRDSSKSLFKGMIRIMEGASKSNSYLSGRSILLDKDAKSDAIPGLEIFTNDVKATHSASVAQIDEEQIFYLGTRCLSRSEAERTIVEGFLEPLSRKMSIQVRSWIAYLIESKWEGRRLSINTDEELRKFTEIEETRYNENSEIEQHYKYR